MTLTIYFILGMANAVYELRSQYLPCGNLYTARDKVLLFVLDTVVGPADKAAFLVCTGYDTLRNAIVRL